MALKFITAEEAASFVHHDDNVGFSGFTPAGCPKVVPGAIAKKAIAEHEKGNPFQIGMFTGASTGDKLDGELARANAIKFRTPYQSNKDLRALLNSHGAQYFDMHLSELAQSLRYGFLGKIDVAIVEAADVTEDGDRSDKRCRYPADNLSHGRSYHHRVELPPPERNPRDA